MLGHCPKGDTVDATGVVIAAGAAVAAALGGRGTI